MNKEEAVADLKKLLAESAIGDLERAEYSKRAPNALERLVAASYRNETDHGQTITRCLASIYNGFHARGVRLDEIRWLHWSTQKDLIDVMVGTGHHGFLDDHIRFAYAALGGEAAVNWFHAHVQNRESGS
jgi:hypothetical protein